MKKIILGLLVILTLASCANYGKKVKVEGTKAEIYYKGDGVTEADAKKTGEFLKPTFFTSDKEASVQLTKEGEAYTIRFVYDKDVYDTLKNVDDIFKVVGVRASKEVFGGKKVNIALANSSFKDYKTIPYDEATAKAMEGATTDGENVYSKADFDHEEVNGINFYWKGVTDDEAKTIADYIVKNGAFSGGAANIVLTKEGDRFIVSFPVKESALEDPAYTSKLEQVSKEIKDNLFADVPYSFNATDPTLNKFKGWDY